MKKDNILEPCQAMTNEIVKDSDNTMSFMSMCCEAVTQWLMCKTKNSIAQLPLMQDRSERIKVEKVMFVLRSNAIIVL